MSGIFGRKQFFRDIFQIKYEETESDNLLAFRWYDEIKMLAAKHQRIF